MRGVMRGQLPVAGGGATWHPNLLPWNHWRKNEGMAEGSTCFAVTMNTGQLVLTNSGPPVSLATARPGRRRLRAGGPFRPTACSPGPSRSPGAGHLVRRRLAEPVTTVSMVLTRRPVPPRPTAALGPSRPSPTVSAVGLFASHGHQVPAPRYPLASGWPGRVPYPCFTDSACSVIDPPPGPAWWDGGSWRMAVRVWP